MVKKATMTVLALMASGFIGMGALASPAHADTPPTTYMVFSGGTPADNLQRCHTYGQAGVVAGAWPAFWCTGDENGNYYFAPDSWD
ncbi:hypothetical protein AB0I81_44170 [Nonomuraea sp. NPDC050404]|uniref:hypothetical protein n=1 Tax=Nonomuraea sp. NPDC050404 TaxID=3155783 RepID=UPI0033C30FB9